MNRAVRFLYDLLRFGPVSWRVRLTRVVLGISVTAGLMTYIVQNGNPHLDNSESAPAPTSSWNPPQRFDRSDPPPPPGFPHLEFPPSMPRAADGKPQSVPTRYGLTYTVPPGEDWMASNEAILTYTDKTGQGAIATYGAVSRYGAGHCPGLDTSKLAYVGVTGRNGLELETAAQQEIHKAEVLFRDPDFGEPPRVEVHDPTEFIISGRPAIRYTATITNIPKRTTCDPDQSEFHVIATPGYATAEVAVFVVQNYINVGDALSMDTVEAIVNSIHKTG